MPRARGPGAVALGQATVGGATRRHLRRVHRRRSDGAPAARAASIGARSPRRRAACRLG